MPSATENAHRLADDRTRRQPFLTICALVVVAAFMLLQVIEPGVLGALRRDLPAMRGGQWWRMLTPLLVQSDGWPQFAANMAGLAVVGAAVERRCGKWCWVGLASIGGLTGEIAGYAWDPTGAGSSLAVCGLIGGLLVWTWRNEHRGFWAFEFSFFWMTALTGSVLFGPLGAVAGCVVLAVVSGIARARPGLESRIVTFGILAMLAEATVLSGLADNHGPAVLAGALAAIAFRRKDLPPAL